VGTKTGQKDEIAQKQSSQEKQKEEEDAAD